MAEIMIAVGAINTLLAALNNPSLKELVLSYNHRKRLDELKDTVKTVNNALLDTANRDELSNGELDYVDKLKEAVYDAEDLFDKFVTKVQRQVPLLVLKVPFYIKKLRKRLQRIAEDHAKFCAKPRITKSTSTETFSSVNTYRVVGRDDDANNVIGLLLLHDSTKPLIFGCVVVAIAGVGGVGKTTLAKLVFGDQRITDKFGIRLWVCVSDQGEAARARIDLKQMILRKILQLLDFKSDDSSTVEFLRLEYEKKLKGKSFLLVLDDLWNEDALDLNGLKDLLEIEGTKCRIIVTTRSQETARHIGNHTYELEGLSDKYSRELFEKLTFEGREIIPAEFVDIGNRIVEKSSHNVPLSIVVIAGLLKRKPISEWERFETSEFDGYYSEGMDDIMSVLKTSYDHLDPSLRNCFAYFAIFPKGSVISKEAIIDLWKAHGYIVPSNGQCIDRRLCEQYFSTFLQRNFFKEVTFNEAGNNVESFKIHDLMHDLAQRVSWKEIGTIKSAMPHLTCSVRHLSVSNISNSRQSTLHQLLLGVTRNKDDVNYTSKIRSHLMFPQVEEHGGDERGLSIELPKKWGSLLRALDLQRTNGKLVNTLSSLLHLRYLNLAHINMKELPNSILMLHNLRTLSVSYCDELQKLPLLRKLPCLESLSLLTLNNLEYVEGAGRRSSEASATFFPSLVTLRIDGLGKLEKWRKSDGRNDSECQLVFPKLLKLTLENCPMLMSFPQYRLSSLLQLRTSGNNEAFKIIAAK